MTLLEYPAVEQGSESWHDLRRGIVTASTVGRLITPSTLKTASNDESRALTRLLAAERITGWTDPTWVNDDMQRGIYDEPIARDLYSEHYAPVTTCGFMVLETKGRQLGFSPDGLVGDDGLVEIKSRRQKKHLQTVLADEVPPENVAQCQAGLFVSGRAWLDYVSYCSGMALFVKRVYPDERWFEAIDIAVIKFEYDASQMVARYLAATAALPMTERFDLDVVI